MDMDLIPVVTEAADRLLAAFSPDARPAGKHDMFEAGRRNENLVLDGLQRALKDLRPDAVWLDDEMETTPLPPGEFWAVDAVEGNVNHVHGMAEWCVTVTLISDGEPVLTVVRQPIGDRTYTAARGEGAYLNGKRMTASVKTDLDAAIVSTGQAEAGQPGTHRRIGESITAMLDEALLVRAFVPSTFPMLLVASGQHDVFWQYEPVLPGIAAGLLLVTEAGGVASRIDGSPWRPGSPDVLVAASGLHSAAVSVLSAVA
jgi:myo-inositol-1(or 4)-monophosphatase